MIVISGASWPIMVTKRILRFVKGSLQDAREPMNCRAAGETVEALGPGQRRRAAGGARCAHARSGPSALDPGRRSS